MQRLLERDALRLRGLARSLEAVSPLATVARGYSILTRSDDGTLVRQVDQAQPGDALQARVGDGVIDAGQVGSAGLRPAPAEANATAEATAKAALTADSLGCAGHAVNPSLGSMAPSMAPTVLHSHTAPPSTVSR